MASHVIYPHGGSLLLLPLLISAMSGMASAIIQNQSDPFVEMIVAIRTGVKLRPKMIRLRGCNMYIICSERYG